VAVLGQRPDTLGVVGLERLDLAEEPVQPADGAPEVTDSDTGEELDVHTSSSRG